VELNNDFRVSVAPPEAWKVLTDVERIAPLLPGAQLQEIEGDEYRGIVKVKVGPVTAQYKGTATFLERDEAAGHMVLKASGRDTRGQGNATATVSVTMAPDGAGTKVNVVTDLTITGKVAQFGRGVMAEVSGKLITQFVDALEADLESGSEPTAADTPPPAEPTATAESAATAKPAATTEAAATTVPTELAAATPDVADAPSAAPTSAGPRRINAPEAKPVDLLDAAGGSLAKRLLPLAGGLAVVVALFLLRRGRHRR
jgi:carbon monoxide dehydrogenase subunit G